MESAGGRHGSSPVRLVVLALKLLWSGSCRLFLASMLLQAVTGLGLGAALLVVNRVMGLLFEDRGSGSEATVIPYVLLLVAIAGCVSFAGSAQMGTRKLLVEYTIRDVQRGLLNASSVVDLEEFERAAFHDRLERARTHAIAAPMAVADAVLGLCMAIVTTVGVGVALLTLAPVAVPIVLAGAIPMSLLGARRGIAMYAFTFGQSTNDRLRQRFEDIVMSRETAKEVRVLGLFRFLERRWAKLYQERLRGESQLVRRNLSRVGIGAAGSAVALGVSLAVMAVLVDNGTLSVSAALTAGVSAQLLSTRLTSAGVSMSEIYENGLYLEDFAELTSMTGVDGASAGVEPGDFKSIEFENVSFSYPDMASNAVENLNFMLRKGEVVALAGSNGSGKTTIAKLASGLYRASSGRVLWSGTDLVGLDSQEVHRHVATIFQDFARYPLSAGENVSVGDVDVESDPSSVDHAIRQAGAQDLISRLTDGVDTVLMKELPGGTDLSGGEWQKIALARTFYRDAPFIILDEPTAALDAAAEYEVFSRMRTLSVGRSVLLISHRFSTVRSADRILVIDEGRIVEDGTHDELMELGGRYRRMFLMQAEQYVDVGSTVAER